MSIPAGDDFVSEYDSARADGSSFLYHDAIMVKYVSYITDIFIIYKYSTVKNLKHVDKKIYLHTYAYIPHQNNIELPHVISCCLCSLLAQCRCSIKSAKKQKKLAVFDQ